MDTDLPRQLELLNQNDKILDDMYHNYAAQLNLSYTAFWILYITWVQGDGCTQKDICEFWSFTKQTVNSALKSLEQKDYIRLLPMEENRKSKQILLTDAGRIIASKIIPPLVKAETISFQQLSKEERQALVSLSQKRTALLQNEMEKALSHIQEEENIFCK